MIVLTFNTKIRDAVQLIKNGDAFSVIDLGNIRYALDLSNTKFGNLIFTPFDKTTQEPIDFTYQYLYGMQSTLKDAILGPGPWSKSPPRGTYPVEPISVEPGVGEVRPNFVV